ncbi:hypothetical protein AJ80_05246 [Polytolypa hystricis UAMH7299]|uniref:O-methyltransferase C-terminal domain-containing protein n=1 Tax=Polytolypa hystricis (strain UAMH7299) TaxID=1447883 RepID=A0A2B7Y5E0_POLH7|nr:hypothetical protein AJ80_05246 [Polytolypa hystricis UAMH7299]
MATTLPPGAVLAATVTTPSSLAFVPVAIHFNVFAVLVGLNKPATAEEIRNACDEGRSEESKEQAPLKDTLLALAGLGLIDALDAEKEIYSANAITQHMITQSSSQDGALHFTTEVLLASAFLMPKLQSTNFRYPFPECDTPMQHAYSSMGNTHLASKHTYEIMHEQARMASFNNFMVGKFFPSAPAPSRMKSLGYDLDSLIMAEGGGRATAEGPGPVIVDIGGGRGEFLHQFHTAYPHLQPSNLILQEHNAELGDSIPSCITVMDWDFKDPLSAQPITGALMYSISHVLHNLPDAETISLLKKLAVAMEPGVSRLHIHENTKSKVCSHLHTTMIVLYGGRERGMGEWRRIAALSGLKITFEGCPTERDVFMEMMRVD